jgi:class 3 adenylate cyclase/tetratricopeptide (TPR) repeat protein
MSEPATTTVLITDMEGSTAFTEGRGDDVAMGLIRDHEKLVREVLATHEGREIKSMGDGFMLAFDSAASGIACALDIQEALDRYNAGHPDQPIRVRMGLNSGPVIEEAGDLYGTTVNATSRIAAKARSGQLLVSESVREQSGDAGDWMFVDRGLFWLKGLRERWTLHEATRGPEHALPPTAEGRTPFIDREDERAALRVYVDAALEGRGGFVLLAGEAGAGKTRLAEEVGAEATGRGMRLLAGRCYEASQAHPFAPFVDVFESVERAVAPAHFRTILGEAAAEISRIVPHIRRRYPEVPTPVDFPDPIQARRYLFASVREVLAGIAREHPLFLVIDDLHWADEQSLLLLDHLAHDVIALPILLVGTYIPAELGASRPLQTILERLHRHRLLERLPIGPLARDDLAALLEALAGKPLPSDLVGMLFDETEGNVFFAEEVFRHLLEEGRLFDRSGEWRPDVDPIDLGVPETIRLTIGTRLAALTEATRGVLTTAAVVGRAFGFELLEALTGMDEEELIDALDEAERARVIASTSEGGAVQFRFSHELTRQTLVSAVSLTRRQLLHQRIGESMETVHASSLPDYAETIAYHLLEAGRRADVSSTARFLVMAGEHALEAVAYEEAQRHLDRALSLLPADEASRPSILEKLGNAQRGLGQRDEAMATWHEALDACEAVCEPDAVARMCLDIGLQVLWWRRARDVFELVDRGLHALGDQDTANRAGLLAIAGTAASQAGNYERANELLTDALATARVRGDERVLGLALYSLAVHSFNFTEFTEAMRFGTESIEHLRRTSDLWTLANALGYVSASATWLGRPDESFEFGSEAESLALKVGNWSAWVFGQRARTNYEFDNNPDPAAYEEDGRRAVELGAEQGFDWLRALGYTRIGLGSFWAGRWSEALEHFERAAQLNVRGPAAGYQSRIILIHAYLGHREQVLDGIAGLREQFARPGQPNTSTSRSNAETALEALAVVGEREAAAALYPIVVDGIEKGIIARGLDYRLLHTLAGIAAGCAAQWDLAQDHFESAMRAARDVPILIEEPEALRFYAQMLLYRRAPADDDRARELLTRAADLYRKFGMPTHEELARELLTT